MITCLQTGCEVFTRRSEASKAVASIRRRRRGSIWTVYRCPYCDHFHIGRRRF